MRDEERKVEEVFPDHLLVACLCLLFARALQVTAEAEKQSTSITKPEENTMNYPPIVSRDEWLVARAELLTKEKEATHARDQLNAQRRRLPMVKIDTAYLFEGSNGTVSLFDLFDGHRQLIIYHFMFDPSWDEGCPMCSFLADNIGHLAHLHARDTSLVLVSRAPLAKIEPFKTRMNWSIPWFSSYGSDFNYDFHATTDDGEARWVECLPARGREHLSHVLDDRARGRSAPRDVQLSRPDPTRTAGELGRASR